MNNQNKGRLFIISAPSGAGKTSLVKRIIQELPQCQTSISHTTRAQRPGEVDGSDYFFISIETFETMRRKQAFLEYAQVFDNFYGTSKHSVESLLNQGNDVILEIDWQGAQQVRAMLSGSVSVFILPPSKTVLAERLRKRGQDSQEIINRRMQDATNEMSHYHEYDYVIVNDQLDQAVEQLKTIISGDDSAITELQVDTELIDRLLS